MGRQHGVDPDVLHRKAQRAVLSTLVANEQDVGTLIDAVSPFDVRNTFTRTSRSSRLPLWRSVWPARRGALRWSTRD